jgi:NADPH:quinone reductase-like Zn-dependent oxidoreductase
MARMKAVLVEEFGEADVLQYVVVERPEPGEGEVLIEVRSAGVNYADTMRRRNSTSNPRTFLSPRAPRLQGPSPRWGRGSMTTSPQVTAW